jgi:hypothetical protein
MIVIEERGDQSRVAAVTCGRTRTRPDAMKKGKEVEHWIRKLVYPMQEFNP